LCVMYYIFMREMLIDCHTHAYPVKVAGKLIPRMVDVYGVKPIHEATIEGLQDSMKASGVGKSLLLTIANRKEHVYSSNTWCISVQSQDLLCFGSIHPDYNEWEDEIERLNDNGVRGLKLQPNAQRFHPDDERLFRIYEKLLELDMALVFHIGDEVKPVTPLYAHPRYYARVLDSFPDLTILLAHLGGYKTFNDLHHVLDYSNVWFDTAFIPWNIPDDLFISLVDEIGIERVVFGSDFPWADPKDGIAKIRELFGVEAKTILEKNPQSFLSKIYP